MITLGLKGNMNCMTGPVLYFEFAFLILMVAALWMIFRKAGKPGWAAIIPIYNLIVLLQIVKKPLWWVILLFIPLVNFVFGIIILDALSRSFGKRTGFTLGLIFLPFIFFPILGFGDAIYMEPPATTSI